MTRRPSLRRTLALLGGIAALLGAMQVDAGNKSNRASAEGSRLAVKIFEETVSSGLRMNLVANATRDQDDLELHAGALRVAAQDSDLAPVAAADWRAAERLRRLRTTMLGQSPDLVGVAKEAAAQKARTSTLIASQNAAMSRVESYSRRSGSASRGLLLVATAGALLTLAASLDGRRPAWLTLGTGALLLCAAAATGVLAVFD